MNSKPPTVSHGNTNSTGDSFTSTSSSTESLTTTSSTKSDNENDNDSNDSSMVRKITLPDNVPVTLFGTFTLYLNEFHQIDAIELKSARKK